MLLSEARPFVRNIFTLDRFHYYGDVKAYDHRIFYVMKGTIDIHTDDNVYNMSEGCLILINAGTKYCVEFEKSRSLKIIILNFDYMMDNSGITDFMIPVSENAFDNKRILENITFDDCDAFNRPLFLKNMHIAESCLLEIEGDYIAEMPYRTEYMSGMLFTLLTLIARKANINLMKSEHIEKVRLITSYINENFDKEITNSSLARILNYHPHYINQKMKSYYKTTLHQYLLSCRLRHAIKLILYSDLPVTEISSMVGFKALSNFSAFFKKKTGVSPAEYRKQSLNVQ